MSVWKEGKHNVAFHCPGRGGSPAGVSLCKARIKLLLKVCIASSYRQWGAEGGGRDGGEIIMTGDLQLEAWK